MPHSKPWKRRDDEGETPYEYFRHYLECGIKRSVKATADAMGPGYNTMRRYSSKYDWAERALAWDNRVIEAQDKATLTAVQKMAAKHMKVTDLALAVAQTTLARVLKEAADNAKVKPSTVREAAALLRDGVTLQRLVTDQATERTEQNLDVSKLEPGKAEELLELLKEAGYEG